MRNEEGDFIAGVSELLLSFAAAFEHIPHHRRKEVFVSLVDKLGPDNFLFALLATLIDKYTAKKEIEDFAVNLTGRYQPLAQLNVSPTTM